MQRAVGVPQAVSRVEVVAAGVVHLFVVAAVVFAVLGVVGHAAQGAIERRIEDRALLFGSARDGDLAQLTVPYRAPSGLHLVESPLGDLFLKVLVGLLDADIGDPDPHTDLLALGSGSIRDQADIGAGPLGLVRNRSALPGAVLTQRFGELGVEVGRNAAPATAASSTPTSEATAASATGLPGHCGRSHHLKFAAEADQEVRMSIRGKREPVVSRVLGHGGFRFDSI